MSTVDTAARAGQLTAEQVQAGEALPELRIPITATLIVTGAIATRDFQKVHHDKDVAQAAGTPNVFMNILTTNAPPTSRATRWSSPAPWTPWTGKTSW